MRIVDHTGAPDKPDYRADSADQDAVEMLEAQVVLRITGMEVNNRTERTIATFRSIHWLRCVAIEITKWKPIIDFDAVDHDTMRHRCVMLTW